jgi:hypothetical protein
MSSELSRRVFIRGAGLAAVGVGLAPSALLVRTARAAGLTFSLNRRNIHPGSSAFTANASARTSRCAGSVDSRNAPICVKVGCPHAGGYSQTLKPIRTAVSAQTPCGPALPRRSSAR